MFTLRVGLHIVSLNYDHFIYELFNCFNWTIFQEKLQTSDSGSKRMAVTF